VIKVTQVVQVVWVVQVVRVAKTPSLDDMHPENIWFSWYKPSKYREKCGFTCIPVKHIHEIGDTVRE
jgi:hypothetical protein